MKNPLAIISLGLLLAPSLASAADHSPSTRALDLAAMDLGPGVELVPGEDIPSLRIDRASDSKGSMLILEIDPPKITKSSYALLGEIRHEGVTGEGFLETWNHFPAEAGGKNVDASYFSRTMGESGPMGKIRGDSGWRPFSLPFFITGDDERRPIKLTWNLHLEGPGLIELRNIRLLDGLPGGATRTGSWWSPQTSGYLGAIFGVIFGIWGSLARSMATRGKHPLFARGSFVAWIGAGVTATLAGVVAGAIGQPFHVVILPVLLGAIMALVGIWELIVLGKRETEHELRRIRAADLT